MKNIDLLGKRIIISKSEVVFNYQGEENWQDYFKVMAGDWCYKDGYLIGIENGNMGGILYTKTSFDFDVLITMNIRTVLPATRDVNAVWCSKWDQKTNYLGDSYVCGLNGWYDHLSGIERCGENGFYTSTSLYKYIPGSIVKLQFGSINGHCFMLVDDKLVTEIMDPHPLVSGYAGISPYCTILEVRSFEVRKIYFEERKQYYTPEF